MAIRCYLTSSDIKFLNLIFPWPKTYFLIREDRGKIAIRNSFTSLRCLLQMIENRAQAGLDKRRNVFNHGWKVRDGLGATMFYPGPQKWHQNLVSPHRLALLCSILASFLVPMGWQDGGQKLKFYTMPSCSSKEGEVLPYKIQSPETEYLSLIQTGWGVQQWTK